MFGDEMVDMCVTLKRDILWFVVPEQGIMEFMALKMDVRQFVVVQTNTWNNCREAFYTLLLSERLRGCHDLF
jgi:hypothetical protein